VVAAITVGLLGLVGPASAQAGSNASATALIFNGARTVPADCPPGGGGEDAGGTFGLVTVGLLTANCTDLGATASAATVTVGTLQLGLVQSQCTTGPTGTASSSVLVISGGGALNGQIVTETVTLTVGDASVTLNEPITEPGFRGFNAVHVRALDQDVIVAQTRCRTDTYAVQVGIGAGTDLGGQPVPAADEGANGAPAWLFWLAAAVLLVAAQATFLPGLLRRRHSSHG